MNRVEAAGYTSTGHRWIKSFRLDWQRLGSFIRAAELLQHTSLVLLACNYMSPKAVNRLAKSRQPAPGKPSTGSRKSRVQAVEDQQVDMLRMEQARPKGGALALGNFRIAQQCWSKPVEEHKKTQGKR